MRQLGQHQRAARALPADGPAGHPAGGRSPVPVRRGRVGRRCPGRPAQERARLPRVPVREMTGPYPFCGGAERGADALSMRWSSSRSPGVKVEPGVVSLAPRIAPCSPSVRADQGTDLVPPTWHFANPNVQVSGVRFAVRAAHAKVRRGGYRAQFPGGADRAWVRSPPPVPASRSSLAATRPPMGQATCFTR